MGAPPVVTLFGQANGFSTLKTGTVPTGQSLTVVPVSSYGFDAGVSAYFAELLPDGKILVSTETQWDNELAPSADHAQLVIFSPHSGAFSSLTLPTSTGKTTAVDPANGLVGGQAFDDLQAIPQSGEVAFITIDNPFNWDIGVTGVYPMLGFLRKVSGVWTINRTYTSAQVAATNPGASANKFEVKSGLNGSYTTANGPAEMALLPRSGYLVVNHYFPPTGTRSGFISVIDPTTGTLKAAYQIPDCTLADGVTTITLSPREVECDPSSAAGDERFIVNYDPQPFGTVNHAIQEFSYNGTDTITPMSVPIIPAQDNVDPSTCKFDSAGNLFLMTHQFTGAGLLTLTTKDMAVYLKKAGERDLVTLAPVAGHATWPTDSFPTKVAPDYSIPAVNHSTAAFSFNIDEQSRVVLPVGVNGVLTVVRYDAGLPAQSEILSADDQSFEGSLGNWLPVFASCTQAQSTEQALDGTHSLKMTSTTTNNMETWTNTVGQVGIYPATPRRQYIVRGNFRCKSGSTPTTCYMKIQWLDHFLVPITQSLATITPTATTTGWVEAVTTGDAPANAAWLAPIAHVDTLGNTIGQVYYLDKVSAKAQPFTYLTNVDLGLNTLRATYPRLEPRKATIDKHRQFWLPVINLQTGFYTAKAPAQLPQWLYKVDLTQLDNVATTMTIGNDDTDTLGDPVVVSLVEIIPRSGDPTNPLVSTLAAPHFEVQKMVVRPQAQTVNATRLAWAATVLDTQALSPATSYYEVREHYPDGQMKTYKVRSTEAGETPQLLTNMAI